MKQVFRQDGQQRTMKTPSKRRRRRSIRYRLCRNEHEPRRLMHSATGRMSVFCCWRQNRSVRAAAAVSAEIQKAWKLMYQRPATWQDMRQYRPATRTWAISDRKNEENGTKYGTGYALGAETAAADLGLGENSITLDYTYRKSSSVSPSYLEKIKAGMVRADRFSSRTVHRIRMYLAQQHLRQAEH